MAQSVWCPGTPRGVRDSGIEAFVSKEVLDHCQGCSELKGLRCRKNKFLGVPILDQDSALLFASFDLE